MGLFSRIAGVVNSFFQVGGPAGPGWNSNSGALEGRNAANSTFAVVRGATPLGDNDLVTKAYADELSKPYPVSLQFNGNSALPANTGTEQYYVVTTTGANATIGQILWDDGSGVGTVAVIPAKTGNEIVTTANFTGGTISLVTNQNYVWSGTAWVNVALNVTGAVYTIDFAITTGASQSSATSIPASAVIFECDVNITTPYSGGATISVGQTGSASLFQATADNTPQTNDLYQSMQRTASFGALPVLVTVAGAPGAGAGTVTVRYAIPLS